MRCTLVLEFDSDAGEPPRRVEALRLHRDTDNPIEGDVGLTLAEAKTVLLTIQQEFVGEQLNQYCAARSDPPWVSRRPVGLIGKAGAISTLE